MTPVPHLPARPWSSARVQASPGSGRAGGRPQRCPSSPPQSPWAWQTWTTRGEILNQPVTCNICCKLTLHWIGPLGRFGLVVTMSMDICIYIYICICPLFMSTFSIETYLQGRQICPSKVRYADLPTNLSISRWCEDLPINLSRVRWFVVLMPRIIHATSLSWYQFFLAPVYLGAYYHRCGGQGLQNSQEKYRMDQQGEGGL